jgi:hypothetical protein
MKEYDGVLDDQFTKLRNARNKTLAIIEAQESAAIAQAKDNARNLKEYNQLQFIAACDAAKFLVGIVYKAENMIQ